MKHRTKKNSSHSLFDNIEHLKHKESEDSLLSKVIEAALVINSDKSDDDFTFHEDFFLNPSMDPKKGREHLNSELASTKKNIKKVVKFVTKHGFKVIEQSAEEQLVIIEGPIRLMNRVFKVNIKNYKKGDDFFHGHTGDYSIPKKIQPIVRSVIGLSKMPLGKNDATGLKSNKSKSTAPTTVNSIDGFTGADFAQFYNYPSKFDGSGECIAVMALGGGYHKDEMKQYFVDHSITPIPEIIDVNAGATNSPGTYGGTGFADVEVCLDVQVAAAAAPGAKIAVYFVEASNYGLYRGIKKAVHDHKNKPSVISISLGNYESTYSEELIQEYNSVFRYAAFFGITVLCSAGNYGATNYNTLTTPTTLSELGLNVQFPASSPYVLAVGGTTVTLDEDKIVKEEIWNAPFSFQNPWDPNADPMNMGVMSTGGGFSTKFKISPILKKLLEGEMGGMLPDTRGIPDVAAHADPGKNGYYIYCDEAKFITAGTSAATPLWAALCARIFQALGTSFFIRPILYLVKIKEKGDFKVRSLKTIEEGNNVVSNKMVQMGYLAKKDGWSACGGLGSPDGEKLLANLRKLKTTLDKAKA